MFGFGHMTLNKLCRGGATAPGDMSANTIVNPPGFSNDRAAQLWRTTVWSARILNEPIFLQEKQISPFYQKGGSLIGTFVPPHGELGYSETIEWCGGIVRLCLVSVGGGSWGKSSWSAYFIAMINFYWLFSLSRKNSAASKQAAEAVEKNGEYLMLGGTL